MIWPPTILNHQGVCQGRPWSSFKGFCRRYFFLPKCPPKIDLVAQCSPPTSDYLIYEWSPDNLEKILFGSPFFTLMFGSEPNAPLKMVWFRKIILNAGLRGDFLQKLDISVRVNAIVRYRNSNFKLS